MNPRERILKTLRLERPDRPPTYGWFHPEVIEKLKKHYKTEEWSDILSELGIEGWSHCGTWLDYPDFESKAEIRKVGVSERKGIWSDNLTYKDERGVIHRFDESGWYTQWMGGPLQNVETPEEAENAYDFPEISQITSPENYAEKVKRLKEQNLFVQGGIANPYKTAWELRGMENILADYLINRELLEFIYDKLYEVSTEMAVRMTGAGVDMISFTGDIAMQDRIIMGPEKWREIDKPRIAEMIRRCREINPNVFFFIHSDGNVWDLMDDLVEIGFNVINPVQPECMDPVEVKKRWGDRITIHGGISLQKTLPFGSVDDVRKEVEDLIINCGYNGGLVVFPSNVIQPDTPVENIITCFQAAKDFRF